MLTTGRDRDLAERELWAPIATRKIAQLLRSLVNEETAHRQWVEEFLQSEDLKLLAKNIDAEKLREREFLTPELRAKLKKYTHYSIGRRGITFYNEPKQEGKAFKGGFLKRFDRTPF